MAKSPFYNRPSKSVLQGLYETQSDEAISLIYNCSESCVQKWRKRYGIEGRKRPVIGGGRKRRFERPPKDKLDALTKIKTDKEIADIYGCTRTSIRKWRESYGLEKITIVHRRRPWAFDLDEDFFAEINTEQKAYILGLLATDGCVSNNSSHSNRVFLSLQARDEHILVEILCAMQANSPVHDRPKGSFPGSGPMKYIALTSRKLVSDLAKLGITPRKSATLTYTTVPHNLERHYIRGLFDGDGTMHPRIFGFLGTEALIDGIIVAVRKHTGLILTKGVAGKLYRVQCTSGSRKLLDWMYKDATIFLHRKHKIFIDHWQ